MQILIYSPWELMKILLSRNPLIALLIHEVDIIPR